MKVLCITRMDTPDTDSIFLNMLKRTILDNGFTFEYCKFTKTSILAGIKRGAKFILNFRGRFPLSASTFMEDDKPGAVSRMLEELSKIEKMVPMYPSVSWYSFTESKKYLDMLPNKTKLFMPFTKTFLYYKTTVNKNITDICEYFRRKQITRIVIKLGWSGWGKHVFTYNLEDLDVLTIKNELLDKLTIHRGICGIPFMVICQPFNEIISDRKNEYRIHFFNGKMSPITSLSSYLVPGTRPYYIKIPSYELTPKNKTHAAVMELGNYGYDILCKYIGFTPLVVRMDISWVLIDGKPRYYINEFEGTNGALYIDSPHVPITYTGDRISDVYDCGSICKSYPTPVIQNYVNSIVDYIKTHIMV